MAGSGDLTLRDLRGGVRRVGPRLWLEAIRAVFIGKPRSLAADATRIAARLDPPARLENLHLIPPHDPFVLVANHFQLPGLWIGWTVAAITSAVAGARAPEGRELHWVALSEWPWFEVAGRWVPNPIASVLFSRASRVWGMIPIPARPADVTGRARAAMQILSCLGCRPRTNGARPEPVGIFPEGRATVALEEPRPGVGSLLHRISSRGVRLLPVGIHQEKGVLVIRFGEPFSLEDRSACQQEDLDAWAGRQIMIAIARLLPERLWGAYAGVLGE